MNYSYRSWN